MYIEEDRLHINLTVNIKHKGKLPEKFNLIQIYNGKAI